MKYKKSQTFMLVAVLIIVLLTAFVLIYLQTRIGDAAQFSSWVTGCKTSVESNARLRFFSFNFAEKIRCPIQDRKIEDSLDDKKGQNAAKKDIIKYIDACKDIYRNGNLDLFTDQNTYCGVCAISDFEDKGKEITSLIGDDINLINPISSDKVYGTIFIYAKGDQEIKEFNENFEREKNSGRIASFSRARNYWT